MDENMGNDTLNLPQEEYEPVVSQPVNMSMLEAEITICAFDIGEDHVFKTCYGDICKTVNALRDYSRILEMSCETWDLQGYHKTLYELHAQKLREIAGKLQAGIGYDYDAAVGKCKKRLAKKNRDDDPGGEALAMSYIKSQRMAAKEKEAAAKKAEAGLPVAAHTDPDDPWSEDL